MATNAPSGPILITGSSSGIGRASALALHAEGRIVYATARRLDSIQDLADQGIHTLTLDVTDEDSMVHAVRVIEAESGPVAVLINNAGYGLYGAVEQVPMADIRRQFDTNFFGLVRLTQLVLPGMRRAGAGRILNVSSMGGRVTLPGGAFYHASKYAVEALSDALRMEVAQFGIDVVIIEPGPVKTPWNDIAVDSMQGAPTNVNGAVDNGAGQDPYADYKQAVTASFASAQRGPLGRLASSAEDIAAVIVKAVTARKPRTRYLINAVAKGMLITRRLLPTRASDAVLARQYGLPR
ncbi:MAG TPA: oxidoreductase [Nakamurella sp.]|nr:oxidoreductase [Nakamurella sp.]